MLEIVNIVADTFGLYLGVYPACEFWIVGGYANRAGVVSALQGLDTTYG